MNRCLFKVGRTAGLLIICVSLMAGCAQNLRTKVTVFSHSAPLSGSVQVVAGAGVEPNSLEFAHYQAQLGAMLKKTGFTLAQAEPDFLAVMSYSVEEVTQQGEEWESTVWVRPGVNHLGFGRAVVLEGPQRKRQFQREVTFYLQRAGSEQRLYEARALSVGACDVLAVVFDEMAMALLEGYPRANGSIQTVAVAGDLRCR